MGWRINIGNLIIQATSINSASDESLKNLDKEIILRIKFK